MMMRPFLNANPRNRRCFTADDVGCEDLKSKLSNQAELGSFASPVSEATWMFESHQSIYGDCKEDDNDVALMIVLDANESDEVSVLSLDNLPDDDEFSMDEESMTSHQSNSLDQFTDWEPNSYSLYCLEQDWFRLSRNQDFKSNCAIYLHGRSEILHTLRGIYKVQPSTVLYLVPKENRNMLRLDKSTYKSVLSKRRYMSLDGAGSLTSVSLSSARSKQMHEV